MSETRYCVLCHQQVWFGAYGTTEEHVDYSDNPSYYESREKVCVACITILNNLPIVKKEEDEPRG